VELSKYPLQMTLSLLPIRQNAGKEVAPILAMIAVKPMGEFVRNNVVDQIWPGSHEINIERNIAARCEAAPSLFHLTNNQMRQP
jgi:hypothetical protein